MLLRQVGAAVLMLGSGALCIRGAERELWKIGKADVSTLEFNSKWDFAAHGDPNYVVGKSDPRTDWSTFHPGSRDVAHGSRPHPFVISFDLASAPAGVFHLTLDLLFKSGGVPQYLVEINGKRGRFLPTPKLSGEIGDPETAWNIVFSRQRLHLALPAALLRAGSNRLALTCLDDNSQPILGVTKATGAESGLYYDALELTNDPEGHATAAMESAAEPTIFYRHGDNGLREVVTLKVSAMTPLGHGSATLTLAGQPYSCNFDSDYAFGDAACAVQVPEFPASATAQLAIRAGANTASQNLVLNPARKWKLFWAPQMHLDMGYTDYRENSYEVHNRNIDAIVAALEKRKDFKFNPDGAFVFADYWEHRNQEPRERVLALMREKRLTLPAQLFTVNTGLASQEELFRLFYSSAEFDRSNGISIAYANQTDVPAHVWALPSYLQAMGIRYLAISSNPFRGAIIPNGRINAKSPFWWEGPDGGRVLTWFSRQYQQFEGLFTKYNSEASGVNSLPIFLQTYSTAEYAPDAVLVYGTQSDNRPFLANEMDFPDQWNKDFAFPNLRISTIDEFFGYVEQNFGASLKTLSGDGGAWWEEMAASNARFAAQARKAKERALAAGTFAALASAVNPDIRYPIEKDRKIWQNLLFYTEHTWGAPATWRRPESDAALTLRRDKEAFSEDAEHEVDSLLRRGLSQVGARVNLRGPAVIVYNSLSWPRSQEIEVEIDRGHGLIDLETGKPVELQLLRRVPDEQYDRVRLRAENVPALGYRSYGIANTGSASEPRGLDNSNTIESPYYRVTVDPERDGIKSIYDKTLGKELVDAQSPYALNQFVYAGYGHDHDSLIQQRDRWNSSLLLISPALRLPELPITTAGQGKVTTVQKTLWGYLLVMTGSEMHTPSIRTEIRLFDHERKIQIWNHLEKQAVKSPEGAYFAFPFAAAPARIRYESQNAWVDPEKDQLPGANKEWFVAQHWVSVSGPDASIGLTLNEAPLLTLGDIDRGLWPKALNIRNGTVFSYVMNNYDGDDERPFQGGDFDFHYSITSDSTFQPEHLARFSREETSALESDQVTEADKLVWPEERLPATGSFLEIDDPRVILAVWKGAEDGRGSIMRFYNTSASAAATRVRFPHLQFKEAYWTNAVENDASSRRRFGRRIVAVFEAARNSDGPAGGARVEPAVMKRFVLLNLLTLCICMAGQPADDPNKLAEVRRLLEEHDWKRADELATALAAQKTASYEAYELLGRVKDAQHRYDEADAAYQRAFQLAPNAASPHVSLGVSYVQRGRPGQALKQFQAALARDPRNLIALSNAGAIELAAKHFAEAEKYYQSANGVAPQSPVTLLGLATAALGAGHQETARQSASLVPSAENPPMHFSLGILFAQYGMFPEAAGQFEAVAAKGVRSAELSLNLGKIYSAEHKYAAAKTNYFQAIDLNPHDAAPYQHVGADYLEQHKGSLAVVWLYRAAKLDDGQPETLLLLGRALMGEEYFQTAHTYLAQYVRKRPEDPKGWLWLGDAFLKRRTSRGCLLELMRRAFAARSATGGSALPGGERRHLTKRYPEAKEELLRAVAIDPAHAEANLRLGEIAYRENNDDDAARRFLAVLTTHPDDTEAAYDLAKVRVRQQQFVPARELLEKIVARPPDDIRFHYLLSQVYRELNASMTCPCASRTCTTRSRPRRNTNTALSGILTLTSSEPGSRDGYAIR